MLLAESQERCREINAHPCSCTDGANMPKKMKVQCCRGLVGVLLGVYRESTSLKLCREEIFSRALPKSCIFAH